MKNVNNSVEELESHLSMSCPTWKTLINSEGKRIARKNISLLNLDPYEINYFLIFYNPVSRYLMYLFNYLT